MRAEDAPRSAVADGASRDEATAATERLEDRSAAEVAAIETGQSPASESEDSLQENLPGGASLALVHSISRRFSNPLPPPNILARYNEIVPGCAEKILDNSISEGPHRRAREKRGQHYALFALFMILAAVLGCTYLGAPWTGCVVAVAGLGGLFISARMFGSSRTPGAD